MAERKWKIFMNIDVTTKYIAALILITYFTQFFSVFFGSHLLVQSAWRFLTSPFNAYFEDSYINNIAFVFFELMIIEIYLRKTNRGSVFNLFFWSSINASYAVSLAWIFDYAKPTAGSSIVGGTLLLVLAFYLFVDGVRALIKINLNWKKVGQKTNILSMVKYFLDFFFAFLAIKFYYNVYIYGNPGAELHVLGLIAFILMFYYGFKKIRRTKGIKIL